MLVVALLGVIVLTAHRSGWLRFRSSSRASTPPVQNTEPPVVEFREAHTGAAGETGSLLTIDRNGQATLRTLPLGPGSQVRKTWLTCDELAWLPQELKDDLAALRSHYGSDGANPGEISVMYRWQGRERSAVWRNPESSPKPPEGRWAALVAPLEDIRRRAQEEPVDHWPVENAIIGYNKISEGGVGTYSHSLSIDKSGHAVLMGGLGWASYAFRGETQLKPDELSTLLRAFEEARFADFQRCYGRHAPVNRQNIYLFYRGNHGGNSVTWMTEGSDPKPPDGWFRIASILDDIWAKLEKGAEIRQALYLIADGRLDPAALTVTFDDMPGLWGGLTLTIHGDGQVTRKAVKLEAKPPARVSRDGVRELARLLLEEKAWEQREPDRASKPDESKARLIIEYGNERSEIWEWYNDLNKNQRLQKIRALMKTITSQ